MTDLGVIIFALSSFLLGGLIFYILLKRTGVDDRQNETLRDLERRLTDLMQSQLREVRSSVDGTSRVMNKQISSFTRETSQMRSDLKRVQETVSGISSFQEIFKSPKLRGEWGEASLTNILSQYYPQELYETQYYFKDGGAVDAILRLPNNRILPIDAKFASDNFMRMIEAEGEQKEIYRKQFSIDLKRQVDSISDKYIKPQEGTVDYAIMYIPAEAVYYEIVSNMGRRFDLAGYAWKKHIIVASPNTFYLTLKTIEHWFKDSQLSKNTQKIIERLERVQVDANKLVDEFRKLGSHLDNARSAFGRSKKRLSLMSERADKIIKEKITKELIE